MSAGGEALQGQMIKLNQAAVYFHPKNPREHMHEARILEGS